MERDSPAAMSGVPAIEPSVAARARHARGLTGVRLPPPLLRLLWRALDALTPPRSLGWALPLLLLGVIIVAVGWYESLPVVLPGDGAYALERALGLTGHKLLFMALPVDAPVASTFVTLGQAVAAVAVGLVLLGVLVAGVRVRLDRFLLRQARELSLIYADAAAGTTRSALPAALVNSVRLGASNIDVAEADVAIPLDETFLKKTLPRCAVAVRELLALTGQTQQNLALARELIAARGAAGAGPLGRLCVRIDQHQARDAIGRDDFAGLAGQAEELRLPSLPSARSRSLLRGQLPIKVRSFHPGARPALVVIGLGDTGVELLHKLASQAQSIALQRPIVVLVDAAASSIERSLHAVSPQLQSVMELVAIPLEARLPESAPQLSIALAERGLLPTCIYLAPEEFALEEAWHRRLDLAYRVQPAGCPLILRVGFPLASAVENSLLAEDERLDAVPRQLHGAYLQSWRASGGVASPATVSWDELPFEYQEDNRAAADHYWMKARELELLLERGHCGYAPQISAPLLEALSQAEHRRWVASRAISGWRLGEAHRERTKEHPSMRPWDELDEAEKQKDRDVVLGTPHALVSAGYALRPVVRRSWPRRSAVVSTLEACAHTAERAVAEVRETEPSAIVNVLIAVEDRASFDCACLLRDCPDVVVSVLASRSLAGFAAPNSDATVTAQRLAEQAWELWQAPAASFDALLARSQMLELSSREA
ncbi:MAG TPA: RyR domain-containing protein [Steroidobacteraceae bacterium]|nr:RyR domain-containing protein [Steroidobacteraceae bacterium]